MVKGQIQSPGLSPPYVPAEAIYSKLDQLSSSKVIASTEQERAQNTLHNYCYQSRFASGRAIDRG